MASKLSSMKPATRPVNSSRTSLLDGNGKHAENVHMYELNSRAGERSGDHLTPKSAEGSCNDNESVRDPSKPCKWKIGWLTPFLIILSFILALLVAIGHYIYCLKLDQRPVDSSVPQSWNSAISLAFARVFSVLLAASASQAFTQLLWRYFRNHHLSVSKIDALFSLNTGPLKLYRLDLLIHVPVLWTFGLFFALIPIATLFPPGALEVNLLAYPRNRSIEVPTLDIDYHGNGSAVAFFQNAMFTPGFDGEYRLPADRYKGLARKTLLQGAFLTRPSPCGLDCSYNLTFAAPSLRCADATSMPNLNDSTFPIAYTNPFKDLEDFDPTHYNYMAAPTKNNNTFLGQSTDDSFVFVVSYRAPDDDSFKYFSCVMMDAMYNSQVTYKNGTQNIDLQINDEKPLNASALDVSSLFYDLMASDTGTASITYPTTLLNKTEEQVLSAMHGTQVRSMGDAMLYCLSGYIVEYGLEAQGIGNTMIQETPLAVPIRNESFYRYIDLRLKLSPTIFEELMRNTTLSIFNDATSMTQTEVAIITYKNAYVFKDPTRLIVSYAATLGVCLMFITLGLLALWRNGVAADSGIFLQVLCAVANGNSDLIRLAKEACLGGSDNHTKELLDLKVRFGDVKDGKSLAAFGTADKVTKLKRGGTYG